MSTATAEKKKKRVIAIRPFIGDDDNMGLSKYQMVVHEGCNQREQITCIEKHGVKKFVTGLDEFADAIIKMPDSEDKKAKIKSIRETVIFLEKALAGNELKDDDKEFWNKVKVVRPDNAEFWEKVVVEGKNTPVFLDPQKPEDLIKICAIEAGGITIVAKSYEDARSRGQNTPKFYLDKNEETASSKTVVTKLQNAAISKLTTIFNENPEKLRLVAKCVDTDSAQYKKSTPNDVTYSNMDAYIKGQGVERNLKKAAETFVAACDLDMEDLMLKAIIRDASFYNLIVLKGDGMLYHNQSASMMGRNISECVTYLKNPVNDKIFAHLQKEVEKQWDA